MPPQREGPGDPPLNAASRQATGRAADFEDAAREVVLNLTPEHVQMLARLLERDVPATGVIGAVPLPRYQQAAADITATVAADGRQRAVAATYLRALAKGYALGRSEQSVEPVWSGPASNRVPARAIARVLIDVVNEAISELILMTYSARPYPPLTAALADAARRGVHPVVVVETLAGAGSALAGEEPAAVFLTVPGVQVWHWPVGERPEHSSKMHAKLAVADRRTLLISSANLTQSGVGKNIEAGLLVRGGTAPVRAAEHVNELRSAGLLQRLY